MVVDAGDPGAAGVGVGTAYRAFDIRFSSPRLAQETRGGQTGHMQHLLIFILSSVSLVHLSPGNTNRFSGLEIKIHWHMWTTVILIPTPAGVNRVGEPVVHAGLLTQA